MSDAKPASRRHHDAELKRQVIAACAAPGASVAQVAMSYGLNANLVHKWRRLVSEGGEVRSSPAFIPVSVVSDGLDRNINRMLSRFDLDVPVLANKMVYLGDNAFTELPPPLVAVVSPAIRLRRVDLPQPEWPMIEIYSPFSMVRSISFNTSVVCEPRVKHLSR